MSYRARRPWTEEEDNLLRAAIQAEHPNSPRPRKWRAIAKHVPGRTNKDCRKRWCSTMASVVAKGGWSAEEDHRLIQAVEVHGTKWSLVAAIVQTRNSGQCAKRWSDTLNPTIDRSNWSSEEDARLVEIVEERGKSWTSIAREYFPGRTGLALKNRHNHLTRASSSRRVYRKRCVEAPGTYRISGSVLASPSSTSTSSLASSRLSTPARAVSTDDDTSDSESILSLSDEYPASSPLIASQSHYFDNAAFFDDTSPVEDHGAALQLSGLPAYRDDQQCHAGSTSLETPLFFDYTASPPSGLDSTAVPHVNADMGEFSSNGYSFQGFLNSTADLNSFTSSDSVGENSTTVWPDLGHDIFHDGFHCYASSAAPPHTPTSPSSSHTPDGLGTMPTPLTTGIYSSLESQRNARNSVSSVSSDGNAWCGPDLSLHEALSSANAHDRQVFVGVALAACNPSDLDSTVRQLMQTLSQKLGESDARREMVTVVTTRGLHGDQ